MRRAALVAALCAGLAATGPAHGARGLFVGASEDNVIWKTAEAVAIARDLGLKAFRVTVEWKPGETQPDAATAAGLERAVTGAFGMRVVLSVYGRAVNAPLHAAARDDYCTFVRNLLVRLPTVNDVVIWNEPNLSFFWRPQYADDHSSAAPAAYAQLLARCWDVLHEYRSEVNVISNTSPRGNDRWWAPSNISHSPGMFIRRVGDWLRASGRRAPLFDTVGHHAYGHSAERPWKRHEAGLHYAQGDLDQLVESLRSAFAGTAQPTPGSCAGGRCVGIWYLEAGYQTRPDDDKRALYEGAENDEHTLPDAVDRAPEPSDVADDTLAPDQATQLVDGIRLAYCQPYVSAFFNFLIWDEPDLARWQSGVLWADGTKKASYDAMQRVVAEVNSQSVDCSKLKGGRAGGATATAPPAVPESAASTGPEAEQAEQVQQPVLKSAVSVEWPARVRYRSDHDVWRFRLETVARAKYAASISRVGTKKAVLSVAGSIKVPRRLEYVRFAQTRLAPGTYVMRVTVTSVANKKRTTLTSPQFVVVR